MELRRHLKRHVLSFFRRIDKSVLGPRYLVRRLKTRSVDRTPAVGGFDSIPLHVINLESRIDRLRDTETELRKMGRTHWSRFDAVGNSNGALGCALSHARLLKQVEGVEPAVIVCEDDIEFLVSSDELREVVGEFMVNSALDVLCLAFHLRLPPHNISPKLAITADTATAACYVVKSRALPLLRNSFDEASRLIQAGKPLGLVAIDRHWRKLQRRGLIFAIPRVRAVRQRPSFSDIEGRDVFYGV